MWFICVFVVLSLQCVAEPPAAEVAARYFAPHWRSLKAGRPFFEGWYTRVQATNPELSAYSSIGFITAKFYGTAGGSAHSGSMVTLLLQSRRPSGLQHLPLNTYLEVQSWLAPASALEISGSDLNFAVRAADVDAFEWNALSPASTFSKTLRCAEMTMHDGELSVTASWLEASGRARNLSFSVRGPPTLWSSHSGLGPEGRALHLPFGLHWFVYSTASAAWFTVDGSSRVPGVAHLEKNWGTAFPDRWVWVQGISNALAQPATTTAIDTDTQTAVASGSDVSAVTGMAALSAALQANMSTDRHSSSTRLRRSNPIQTKPSPMLPTNEQFASVPLPQADGSMIPSGICNASLALAGGSLSAPFVPRLVSRFEAFLVRFEWCTPRKCHVWTFSPMSQILRQLLPCTLPWMDCSARPQATLRAHSRSSLAMQWHDRTRVLDVNVFAPLLSMSDADDDQAGLPGPGGKQAFIDNDSAESYLADATVRAWEHGEVVAQVAISNVALEFGGNYRHSSSL